MPHQCVRCSKLYPDTASELLEGCSCGGKLFFYVKKERLNELKESTVKLNKKEKTQIEKDVFDIIGQKKTDFDKPIILDLESIRVLKPGQYELDLVNLFSKRPLVYKLEEGKYIIDLPETFINESAKE
jgi:predicted  nucleic acid-binding Zn-ribbon protein